MLGVRDAARALGVSRHAVRKAIVRGTLPARLVGRSYEIDPAAVETYGRDHLRADDPGRRAYATVARSLSGVDDETIELARGYARRRHRAWPPR